STTSTRTPDPAAPPATSLPGAPDVRQGARRTPPVRPAPSPPHSGLCGRLEERQHGRDPPVHVALRRHVQLLEQRADVLLDGSLADVQPGGDRRVSTPGGHLL